MKAARISTGASGLDSMLEGGFPKGSLILVTGIPGAGKTIFSTQFLIRGAGNGERGVYVSFTEDAEDFRRNARLVGFDLTALERKGLIKILDCLPMNEEGMKDLLGEIVRSVHEFKAQRIVVDSVTAILQVVGLDETRAFLQTMFGRITKKQKTTSLLIGETPNDHKQATFGIEEFVADGLITLGRSRDDFRTLTVRKMRASRIYETNTFFTLNNGFQALQRQGWIHKIKNPAMWKPIHDYDLSFSTGSSDLDTLLEGGYPKGGYIVLEAEANVPISVIRLFELPLAWNFISQNRGVLFASAIGADSEAIRQLLTRHADHKTFMSRVRVFEQSTKRKDQRAPFIIGREPNEPVERIEELLHETTLKLNKETGQPVVRIIGLPALVVDYAGHVDLLFKQVGETIAYNRSVGNLTLAVTRSGQEITSKVLDIVDWHIRLIERNGHVFMRVVKPKFTPYVAVGTEIYNNAPRLTLTPLV